MDPQRTYVVVTHRQNPTLADDLKTYLDKKGVKRVIFIAHEFASLPKRRSFIEQVKSGQEVIYSPDFRFLPDTAVYLKDIIYTLWWLVTKVKHIDVYIGYGAFNALPAVLLRKILNIEKIVFYTVDFVPDRFGNKYLNQIYRLLDRYILANVDETWNLSPRMALAREQLWNEKLADFPNQFVVPVGVWPEKSGKNVQGHADILFSGHILEKQGVQKVIEAMQIISKTNPKTKLYIVGNGPYLEPLHKLAHQLKLERKIVFMGNIDEQTQNGLAAKMGVAVATYDPNNAQFSYYADSAKLKKYLSLGLPTVLTDITYNAQEFLAHNCGIVVKYDAQDIAQAIVKILRDYALQEKMKKNALKYSEQFNWTRILDQNFQRLLAS